MTLLAFGDYGVGITNGDAGRRQHAVARTLEHLAANRPVRLVITLGDNIYHGPEDRLEQSGDEDDDWYFTFYEPYRYLLDHLPFYPAAGNHDGSDEEATDDRGQLADNFHLESRFRGTDGRASLDPGLFYRVDVGSLLQLLCVDTSSEGGRPHFEDAAHRAWLEKLLTNGGTGDGSPWIIPFCHHPAYCAGPHHPGMAAQVEQLVPLYRRAGVRLVLSGHEHNFQHARPDGVDYIVSGAAGKLQEDPPTDLAAGATVAWASAPHCLLVEVEADRVVVTPFAAMADGDDEPRPLERVSPDGSTVDGPIVLRR